MQAGRCHRAHAQADRPVAGLTVRRIVEGIKALRQEYCGYLTIQTMLLPINKNGVEQLVALLNEIQPDEGQLNLPSCPVPREWTIDSRGNHERSTENATKLKLLRWEEVDEIEHTLRRLTGLPLSSAYRRE